MSEQPHRNLIQEFNTIKRAYEQRSREGAIVWVNGERIQIPNGSISAEDTVLDFLRLRLQLTSCKLGCGEGGCGACTGTMTTFSFIFHSSLPVMVSAYDDIEGRVIHKSVNGCLTPILSLHGSAITTTEGN